MTLQEAVANVPVGGTITMLRDVSLSVDLQLSNKTVTLDLGGYTLSRVNGHITGNITLWIQGGTVTIKNGTINNTWNGGRPVSVSGGANVTIESGTYTGTEHAIYCYGNGSTVTIVSGQFSCTAPYDNDGCLGTTTGGQIVLAPGSVASINPFVNNGAATSVTVTH